MPSRATYHLFRAAEEMVNAAEVVEAHEPDSLLAKDLRADAEAMMRRRETVKHVPDMPEEDPEQYLGDGGPSDRDYQRRPRP